MVSVFYTSDEMSLCVSRRTLHTRFFIDFILRVFFFFFFQAEDGIRDLTVTGVQTCALPILPLAAWAAGTSAGWVESASFLKLRELSVAFTAPATWASRLGAASMTFTLEIGRASW